MERTPESADSPDPGRRGGSFRREGDDGRGRTPAVVVLALGNPDRGDDGAALEVAARLQGEAEVILAGRPGAGLLELLPTQGSCLLMDVTWSGSPPGTLHRIPLERLSPETLPDLRVSSHGFGAGEALQLGRALGRALPQGLFLGIEGEAYGFSQPFSRAVSRALPDMVAEARAWLARAGG